MQSRIIQITVLAFLFAFAPPLAAAEAGDDKAAFRVAYKAYQAAVAQFRYAPAIVDGEFTKTPGVRNLINFQIGY